MVHYLKIQSVCFRVCQSLGDTLDVIQIYGLLSWNTYQYDDVTEGGNQSGLLLDIHNSVCNHLVSICGDKKEGANFCTFLHNFL